MRIEAAPHTVAGEGPPGRRREILAVLDAIIDPCSMNIGRPIGLVGMGIIERLDVVDSAVLVDLLPTFPTCMFRGVFEEEIEKRLAALPWCTDVSISFNAADRTWDESRLSPAARRALGRTTGSVVAAEPAPEIPRRPA